MELKFYNTLTREKEPFISIEPGKVGLYTCGFTVYDYAHVGNLRSYIFADLLKRTLTVAGYKVRQVENITDVGHLVGDGDEGEDKMEVGARKSGKSVWEIAKYYTDIFKNDLKKANVTEPNVWASATEYIAEQIEFIKALEAKGFAYKTSDGVYFDTGKLTDYGKLAMLDLAGQKAGARVERSSELHTPRDFALWKFLTKEKNHEMKWESPWGVGFPGWHIECSAIGAKFLGEHFDIHTGGIDHIPVHHTNEIAQYEGRYGHKVVNFWMHHNFLLINGEKMSKSLGNLYTLDDIEKRGFSPLALRYLYLGTHYRQQLNFTWESLEAAQNAYTRIWRTVSDMGEGWDDNAQLAKFETAMADDLNTPQALAILWANTHNPKLIYKFDEVLGLGLKEAVERFRLEQADIPADILKLNQEREEARMGKDWGKADELRHKMAELGWSVEDTADGSRLAPL
ncbi:MAG TPA: cysteine--tRNA ligase [Candidatus Paceibacterota bacterium]